MSKFFPAIRGGVADQPAQMVDPIEEKRALGGRTRHLKEEEEEALKQGTMTHAVANPGKKSDFDHSDHALQMHGTLCLNVIRSCLECTKRRYVSA
ncbi:hypothetical protein GOZ78_15640 [Agrobacterium vitis]|uniref:Uncharacterized protein n=1 Tax=Agrobacterium vitis TaxID=373 RepID=A0ABD6GHJ3_AGRVI|nr:hypothetical protein [Agrobacterium vitis]MUO78867.1 hypothetical protein [Agrobacterium vitis]MUO94430.1 hypothetical protein [Agrobacterium vitis]MUP06089.1 hypothetical protein [Agrobacterium vitis]MUZ82186.1 hypothetical protein [Agrobacterium vitis]MVA11453.1 hypothetical protein [Agrobacterium vitis]